MLPHSTARLKRICSSDTKCRATCGNPFLCKYAMIACPLSLDCLMIRTTRSNSLLCRQSLNMHSVVSTISFRTCTHQHSKLGRVLARHAVRCIHTLPSRSKQCTVPLAHAVIYTGTCTHTCKYHFQISYGMHAFNEDSPPEFG